MATQAKQEAGAAETQHPKAVTGPETEGVPVVTPRRRRGLGKMLSLVAVLLVVLIGVAVPFGERPNLDPRLFGSWVRLHQSQPQKERWTFHPDGTAIGEGFFSLSGEGPHQYLWWIDEGLLRLELPEARSKMKKVSNWWEDRMNDLKNKFRTQSIGFARGSGRNTRMYGFSEDGSLVWKDRSMDGQFPYAAVQLVRVDEAGVPVAQSKQPVVTEEAESPSAMP